MKTIAKPEQIAILAEKLEKARGFAFHMVQVDTPLFQRAFILALKAELNRPMVEVEIPSTYEVPLYELITGKLEDAPPSAGVLIYSPTLFMKDIGLPSREAILCILDIGENRGKYIRTGRPMVLFLNPQLYLYIESAAPGILNLLNWEFYLPSLETTLLKPLEYIPPEESEKWLALLESTRKQIRARDAQARFDKAALDFSIGVFTVYRNLYRRARKLFRQSLKTLQDLRVEEPLYFFPIFLWAIWNEVRINEIERARQLAQEFIKFAEGTGSENQVIFALVSQALVEEHARNLDAQRQLLLKALEKTSEGSILRGMITEMLGDCTLNMGNLEEAAKWYEEVYSITVKSSLLDQQAPILHKLGKLWTRLGKRDEAIKYLRKALNLYRKIDDRAGVVEAAFDLALELQADGQIQEAEKVAKEALYTAQRLGRKSNIGAAALLVGRLARLRKDLDEAEKFLSLAAEQFETLHMDSPRALTLLNLAQVLLDKREYKEAKAIASEISKLLRRFDNPSLSLQCYIVHARASMGLDKYANACHWLEKALSLIPEIEASNDHDRQSTRAHVLELLLDCLWYRGHMEEFSQVANELVETYKAMGDTASACDILDQLGTIYWDMEWWDKAEAAFKDILKLIKEPETEGVEGKELIEAKAFLNLAELKLLLGSPDEARTYLEKARQVIGDNPELNMRAQELQERLAGHNASQASKEG